MYSNLHINDFILMFHVEFRIVQFGDCYFLHHTQLH